MVIVKVPLCFLVFLGSSIPTIITEQIQEAPQPNNPSDTDTSTASLFTAIKRLMMTPLSTTASASRLHDTAGFPLVAQNNSDSSSLLPQPSLEAPGLTDKMITRDSSQRRDISAVLKVHPASCQGPSRKLQLPSSSATNRLTSEITGPVAQLSNDAHPVDSSPPLSVQPDDQQQARVESTKEILVKQQELIQQLLQQQQQQQQQSGFNNRTL